MSEDFERLAGELVIAQALGGGTSQNVGTFRFYFEAQDWEWSEQV